MNSKFLKKYAALNCCAIVIVLTASAGGQAGKLDNTFGNGGVATQQSVVTQTTDFYLVLTAESPMAIVVQPTISPTLC